MGIYLPKMEMPKEGSWTTVRIYPDGTCAVPNWQGDCTLIKGTKAVPVPPHGRCIDADALIRELTLDDEDDNSGASLLMAIFLEVLKAAPAIIEAEEGE